MNLLIDSGLKTSNFLLDYVLFNVIVCLQIWKFKFDFYEFFIFVSDNSLNVLNLNSAFVHPLLESINIILVKARLTFELVLNLSYLYIQICESVFKLLISQRLFSLQAK